MTKETVESAQPKKVPLTSKEGLNRDQIKARKWWTIAMIAITAMMIAITKAYWVVIIGAAIWYFGLIRWMRFLA